MRDRYCPRVSHIFVESKLASTDHPSSRTAGDDKELCFRSAQEVLINVRVKAIDTGLQHCIAVSECGRDVFAWGKAARGQLGNIGSDQVSFATPQIVRGISGIVTDVSAGLNHSAAVTADGAVYLWGKGMSDELDTENKNGNITVFVWMLLRDYALLHYLSRTLNYES